MSTTTDDARSEQGGPGDEVAGSAPGEVHDVTFPALDTLRAVGAVAVLTTHVAFWAGDYTVAGWWGTLLARLDVGVALFFVLSGFLLSRPWLARALDRRPAPATGRYLWKRLLRIAPLYLLTCVLALSLIGDNAGRTPGEWVATLLLLDTLTDAPDPAGLTHMWSLAVEVSYYLVLPLLMWVALGRRRFRLGRLVAVLVALVALTCWWHLDGAGRVAEVTPGNQLQWLPAYLSWFALGIAIAAVHELQVRGLHQRWTAPVVALGRQPGACWALAAGLLLLCATPLAGPSMLAPATPAESLTKSLVYAAIGGLVVVTGVWAPSGGAYLRVMAHPAARHLGVISYGLFALHLPVLHLVMHVTGWTLFEVDLLPLWLLTLLVSLVVAEAAYRLVERPALRLKNLRLGRPGR
ncbi:acyltransferase [Nocardioides sp. C4-1]|uniref:acyltransferase family protein n=1 Tax=Nocardioides sp. C4-1 TaxID=3151851 RepID=UPI003264640F